MADKKKFTPVTDISNMELKKDDFSYVRSEKEYTKIHDEKLQTKATTFARDCFKRFCKSKSSVVAAIIIGLLLIGSFLIPVISPYSTTTTHYEAEKLLPPKLFNAGTGWWDGCQNLEHKTVKYDEESKTYVPTTGDYKRPNCIIPGSMRIESITYHNYASPNFVGGNIVVYARNPAEHIESNRYYFKNKTPFKLTADGGYKVSYFMNDHANFKENFSLTDYRVVLECQNTSFGTPVVYPLTDWSTDYPTDKNNPKVLDLSKALEDAGISEYKICYLKFEGMPKPDSLGYFMVSGVNFTATEELDKKEIAKNDIVDPNATYLLKVDKGITPDGMWHSTGDLGMYNAAFESASFRYDLYEHYLGRQTEFVVGQTKLQEWIDKGWCTYTWGQPNSFVKLSDDCPIVENNDSSSQGKYVYREEVTYYEGQEVRQLYADVTLYKYYGYKEMPRFVFGTDNNGNDEFTICFRCLKNSLLLSIICCFICITIGLIWGSVSGYYGGAVDLTMERITDILSGVPSTVVLTLMLLLLGRTTVTFALAVCMTGWIGTSALTRTQFYRFKNREHVLAARTLGARDSRLIFRHILPNSLGTIVTSSVLSIPGFIFTEASLSFLHLGLDSGDSFGVLISNGQQYVLQRPLLIIVPTLILMLLMISFNLFGNGLRDALNPTLKGGDN